MVGTVTCLQEASLVFRSVEFQECAVRLNNSHLLEKRRNTKESLFFELNKWASEGFKVNCSEADRNHFLPQGRAFCDT